MDIVISLTVTLYIFLTTKVTLHRRSSGHIKYNQEILCLENIDLYMLHLFLNSLRANLKSRS